MGLLLDRIGEAVAAVRRRSDIEPEIALVIGTGLGELAEQVEDPVVVGYDEIPGFPKGHLEGHAGRLVLGRMEGKAVVVMDGRFHLYEGFTLDDVTLPIRVMRALGASVLMVSNAAGGLNPLHEIGDIVVIDDHIGLFGPNALIGENEDTLGPRFPDMSRPYDRDLSDRAISIAMDEKITVHKGVYVWVTGPTLETRAEYRLLRMAGADVVGMSTVPEVIVAVHGGMRVVGFSVLTDRCLPDALKPTAIEDIIAVANSSGAKLARIVRRLVSEL